MLNFIKNYYKIKNKIKEIETIKEDCNYQPELIHTTICSKLTENQLFIHVNWINSLYGGKGYKEVTISDAKNEYRMSFNMILSRNPYNGPLGKADPHCSKNIDNEEARNIRTRLVNIDPYNGAFSSLSADNWLKNREIEDKLIKHAALLYID